MRKLFILFVVLVLVGCETRDIDILDQGIVEEAIPAFEEVIVSRRPYGEQFYARLTTTPQIVENPEAVNWQEASRLIVVFDESLMADYPPSHYGIDILLEPGMVYNIEQSGQRITFIYPTSQQSFSSLANEVKDELFTELGALIIEDFYPLTGTVIILDSESRKHLTLFNDFPERSKQVTVLNHSRISRFETIVFIYHSVPQDALLEMNPPSLPNENHVLEFVNQHSQRVIIANLNDVFMPQMISTFIGLWGESFVEERSLIDDNLIVDVQALMSLRLPPNVCKIPSFVQSAVSVGFPLPPLRVSTIGNVRAKVVYVDFLDYRLNESGVTLESRFLRIGDDVNKYFDTVSYGQIIMEWDIHPEPLLMPKNVAQYQLTREAVRPGNNPMSEFFIEILELHRNAIDFTGADVIVVMFNPNVPERFANFSPAHLGDMGYPFVTSQGNLYNAVTIASDWPTHKWQVIVHELAHTLGLIDLYDFEATSDWNGNHRHVGGFDIMGALSGSNIEFLGWNRYLMNWVNDPQVFCMDHPKESITIPIQTIGRSVKENDDLQMIVLPLDRYKVLVIEAKEKNPFCLTCDGLLVYTVDTRIQTGRGAIKVIPVDRSIDVMKDDAMIRVGESLVTHSVEIALLSASPNGYVVELRNLNN
jgi:M6 family metalloprotease-like protein